MLNKRNIYLHSGRTLLEMIGVLAIAAILTITVLHSFSFALSKLEAERLAADLRTASFVLESGGDIYSAPLNVSTNLTTAVLVQESSAALSYTRTSERLFDVTAAGVSKSVCAKMKSILITTTFAIKVNGNSFNSTEQCRDVNTLSYSFTIPLRNNPQPQDAGYNQPVPCNGLCHGCAICDESTQQCVDKDSSCASGFICSQGACVCPNYLTNVGGTCRDCLDSSSWNETQENCSKCPDRSWFDGVCYPECAEGFYRNDGGLCRECEDQRYMSTSSPSECNRCAGYREGSLATDGKYICHKICSESTPIAGLSACSSCDASKSYIEVVNEEECLKCGSEWFFHYHPDTNQALCHSPCAVGQVRDYVGRCLTCDLSKSYIEGVNEEACLKCGSEWFFHYRQDTSQSFCYSPCAVGQVRDYLGRCLTCGKGSSDLTEESCASCGNDTNFWDTQYSYCRTCTDAATRTSTKEECHRCSNRFFFSSNSCARCDNPSNPVMSGTEEENKAECDRCPDRAYIKRRCYKPCSQAGWVRSETETCYSCSEETSFKTVESECLKCPGRTYNATTHICSLN